ncbi:2848_t:CDS:2 [Funneliformis caledonium]|uniref:2848_t:CDS:1 n=1 Tax=Funneliformis caledonium TaxID=1117310 RepID=A0A9N9BQ72_9GLOM|nr:2848_t:CDS:2 [Funneliformis caledonium]
MLKISSNEMVDLLRPMIKKRWPSLFENILPTNFILRKINSGVVINILDQIRQYNNGQGERGEEMFPYQLISSHFPQQPPNNKIHIIVLQLDLLVPPSLTRKNLRIAYLLHKDITTLRGMLPSLRETLPSLRGTLPSLRGMLPSLRGMLPSLRGMLPSLLSPPEYRNYNCCGKPERSVMCSGDLQGITEKELETWLKSASTISFVHIIKKIYNSTPLEVSSFFSRYKDVTMDGPQNIAIKISASYYFSIKRKVNYLKVREGKKPKPDSASTSVEKALETEEQQGKQPEIRNHEELKKAPEEKSKEEIYNDDIPFAISDENHKEELQPEIEEQRAPEEKSEKEIYNDDIPFAISDDVEKRSNDRSEDVYNRKTKSSLCPSYIQGIEPARWWHKN